MASLCVVLLIVLDEQLTANQLKSAEPLVTMPTRKRRRLPTKNAAEEEKRRIDASAIGVLDPPASPSPIGGLPVNWRMSTSAMSKTHSTPPRQKPPSLVERRRRIESSHWLYKETNESLIMT
jgi:hypothetical protein